MQPILPLALHHSWPLADAEARFVEGRDGVTVTLLGGPPPVRWQCLLADEALIWEAGVFALFGLPVSAAPARADAVAVYDEGSRVAMERLRAHAIRHRRGFTLDAFLRPADGAASRWMRLVTAPVIFEGRVIAIEGLKQNVTHLYAGG